MNTENTIEPLLKNSRKWWVKFNKDNGKIFGISKFELTDELAANELVISTNNSVCKDISTGKRNVHDYAVIWDIANEKWDVDKKKTTLDIRVRDNKLRPYKKINPSSADMYIKVFKEQNLLDIYVNFENIRVHKNLGEILHISNIESNLLDLYITKRKDPDYLISIIHIDNNKLFEDKRLTVHLPELNIIDWGDISIYTKPVFFEYGIEFTRKMTNNELDFTKDLLYYHSVKDVTVSNINIVKQQNKLFVKSDLTREHLHYFDNNKFLKLEICDSTVDAYVGTIQLPRELLINSGPGKMNFIDIPMENWPDNPLILHKHKKITISYTTTENKQ